MIWKDYETSVRVNSFGLNELYFDMEDVVLQGTSDSEFKMDRIIPRFQVRLNKSKTQIDAFVAC